ncbi:winged helix DNA-binding domain-containing protein [Devosia sp.]|uniref:winged helix DNA-binding domain-containing protein n=1 Tax=Devosia sp. TaxID=1871048 RepID=UPI003263814A
MTGPTIATHQLNRALLARQLLLERSDLGIVDAIDRLGGLQAQTSNAPYHGLWSRLAGFSHDAMTALIVDKSLVRAATLRATLHLHTAADLLSFRPLLQSVMERGWAAAYTKRFADADKAAVMAKGIAHLDRQQLTNSDLAQLLAPAFPGSDPHSMAQYLHCTQTLVQVPPTRLWNVGRAPLLQRIETYLPGQTAPAFGRRDLVLRYLRAFGPASVQDMQQWCGLTLLTPDFEALRDQLVTFTDDTGRELFDLPNAPRPDADTPAPIRFIPEYDNIFLGFANRTRIVADDIRPIMFAINRYNPPILIDGMIEGAWWLKLVKGVAHLRIATYVPIGKRTAEQIEAEGLAFAHFCQADAKAVSVDFDKDLLV